MAKKKPKVGSIVHCQGWGWECTGVVVCINQRFEYSIRIERLTPDGIFQPYTNWLASEITVLF